MKIAFAAGVTAAVVMFLAASTREDIDLGVAVLAAIITGLAIAGLVALWTWALV